MHQIKNGWKSRNPVIPGANTWGKILAKLSSKPHVTKTAVNIRLGDEDFSLAPFGIPGKVIYTPGHTMGSVSILLETGDAFVGDLVMSGFPLRLNPGLPIFAEDIKRVKESIRKLLDRGVKTIYPAHGKPFSAQIVNKFL